MTELEIEAFLAIVHYQNITAAAEHLFISQPAITRRIQSLENELHCQLFQRKKGQRNILLTEQGIEFVRIARKWTDLWEKTRLFSAEQKPLNIASVYAVSHPFLSQVLPDFLASGFQARVFNILSYDAYRYMEEKLYDIAFITMQDYSTKPSNGVITLPLLSESMVLLTARPVDADGDVVDLHTFEPEKEIFVPWCKEYSIWHSTVFREVDHHLIHLDDASMIEYFLTENSWVIAPFATAYTLKKRSPINGMTIYHMQSPPPNRIIYYLTNIHAQQHAAEELLKLIGKEIRKFPSSEVTSLLSPELTIP